MEAIGYAAAFCTTIAFLPQVIKAYRTKSVTDLSFFMIAIFNTGVLLWLIYGLWIESPPVILANGCTIVLSLIMLFFKLRYEVKK